MLTILENCRISPPPATVGERSLPLTFFDTIWLIFSPIHQVFFYEFPHSKQHFIQTIVPKIKHSLSITLQHFFPFASNLIVFPKPNHSTVARNPEIRHLEGDSVAVTFAECDLDFNDLTGNHPRNCNKFYPLVPLLPPSTKVSDYVSIPLFSVQVTLFENSGVSIGLTNHHTLCDASTRFNFLKAWTSIARNGSDELFLASGSLPFYDRVIKYPTTLDEIHLNQPGIETIKEGYQPPQLDSHTDRVRATVVLTQAHINRLKKWVRIQQPTLEYVSSFSVACAFVWSCTAKSLAHIGDKKGDDDIEMFVCAVDWRSRFDPPIPQTYFGNCVGPCITPTTKSTLLAGEKGFLVAAELFGKALSETIKNKDGMLKEAETWLKRVSAPVPSLSVSGTPKIKIYDVDFGWGKPRKHETISLDYNRSISVNACKESTTDIEIGLSFPAKQMDAFITVFERELETTCSEQE
ncbi:Chloramphenicol acetyltransferase-like domain-containing protein [Cynara cardunculus var. scolymus]|uniref:Chloramphenicol acetyltransferase-like domain-containing protein n=2 Tax=Cynara cardunculus var. scolymus TaxID=59895 RepID=A0A124SFS4_CYNCS|nr:Chloramphenicol acetyltransferase-like domain-containing protein [Cynara cardunculus var. scolymus]